LTETRFVTGLTESVKRRSLVVTTAGQCRQKRDVRRVGSGGWSLLIKMTITMIWRPGSQVTPTKKTYRTGRKDAQRKVQMADQMKERMAPVNRRGRRTYEGDKRRAMRAVPSSKRQLLVRETGGY
jgi:hypothetical protein